VWVCLLESETIETKDVDLRRECTTTLGYLSQAQLSLLSQWDRVCVCVCGGVYVCILVLFSAAV